MRQPGAHSGDLQKFKEVPIMHSSEIRALPNRRFISMAAVCIAVATALCGLSDARADVLAAWTFEVNTPADLSNSAAGPIVAAEVGTGSMQGVHANAASDWTTPSGNGSFNSYSVNEWAIGDYFQFTTSSIGYEDISIKWDQASSTTGPGEFSLSYATSTSGPFTTFSDYTVLASAAPPAGPASWTSGTYVSAFTYNVSLASIAALEDAATIVFRLVMRTNADSTPTTGTTSTVQTAGTDRVDNVEISGALIPDVNPVPLPGSAFVFMFGAAVVGAARKKIKAALC
jgi:hypothetical protein